jgi:hydrogenase maturation protease
VTSILRTSATDVLVAGVGNVFIGDDGFGVEVVRRLARRSLPAGVTVQDFGIRGFDLAFALRDYDTVVLVDTVPVRDGPGTLHWIDASEVEVASVAAEAHGMDPAKVLAFARELGPMPKTILVLGCEPAVLPDPSGEDIVRGLSPPVLAAVDEAVEQLETLVPRLTAARKQAETKPAEKMKMKMNVKGTGAETNAESRELEQRR